MTPCRVAYVVNMFPKLSETFIAYELMELQRRGVAVLVLSLRQPADAIRHEFIGRSGLDTLAHYDARTFLPVLRQFSPELIHAHFATEPAGAARELAAQIGAPFTFTAHGYDIRRKPPPDFQARAAAARAVVTVSQANARHIVETFGVPAHHLRVIPCGVDTERFRPAPPANRRDRPPTIVCVARHVPVKNLGLLLRACAILRDRKVVFRCSALGDGPTRPELEALRAQLQLEPWVELPGAADENEVLRWWQRATVGVLTSQSEGMPVSLMEAAACGVPAVATAVGGLPELIDDGVTGRLSPPGDAPALATALQELIEDPSRAEEMGRAARRRAEERFSLARQVDLLLELWREVVP